MDSVKAGEKSREKWAVFSDKWVMFSKNKILPDDFKALVLGSRTFCAIHPTFLLARNMAQSPFVGAWCKKKFFAPDRGRMAKGFLHRPLCRREGRAPPEIFCSNRP
jgi:hypothetical protein